MPRSPKDNYKIEAQNDYWLILNLQAPTPQNGPTHSNNLSDFGDDLFEVCLIILSGWRLKD